MSSISPSPIPSTSYSNPNSFSMSNSNLTSPQTSPPTSPTPTRIPKPKGNRLVKSDKARSKSPGPGKSPGRSASVSYSSPDKSNGSLDRRTSLQAPKPPGFSTPSRPTSYEPHSPSSSQFFLSGSSQPPTTPTISVSFVSSGGSQPTGGLTPNGSSSNLQYATSNWVPGEPYMPAANSTSLSQLPVSLSDPGPVPNRHEVGLIPPEGLAGPLQVREAHLLARDRERAAALAVGTSARNSLTSPNRDSAPPSNTSNVYSSSSHGLLEAAGLLHSPDRSSGRFKSTSSFNSSIRSGSTTNISSSFSVPTVVGDHMDGGTSLDGSDNLLAINMNSMSSRDGTSGDQSLASGSRFDTINLGSGSSCGPAAAMHNQPSSSTYVENNGSQPRLDGGSEAGSGKRSRKGSIRSTLPSIRSFKNPFSFSRSASASATTGGDRSRERSPEKKNIPIGVNPQKDISSQTLLIQASPGPSTSRSTGASPTEFVFPNMPSSTSLPKPSTPAVASSPHYLPHSRTNSITHSVASTKTAASSSKFGFGFAGNRNANNQNQNQHPASHLRHSLDTPATFGKLGQMFSMKTGSKEGLNGASVNGSNDNFAESTDSHGHPYPSPVPAIGRGRASPAWNGRASPAFPPPSGLGLTGIGEFGMRSMGQPLEAHQELDERSLRTDWTESGYGFGGIQISKDGIILSPVMDTEPLEGKDYTRSHEYEGGVGGDRDDDGPPRGSLDNGGPGDETLEVERQLEMEEQWEDDEGTADGHILPSGLQHSHSNHQLQRQQQQLHLNLNSNTPNNEFGSETGESRYYTPLETLSTSSTSTSRQNSLYGESGKSGNATQSAGPSQVNESNTSASNSRIFNFSKPIRQNPNPTPIAPPRAPSVEPYPYPTSYSEPFEPKTSTSKRAHTPEAYPYPTQFPATDTNHESPDTSGEPTRPPGLEGYSAQQAPPQKTIQAEKNADVLTNQTLHVPQASQDNQSPTTDTFQFEHGLLSELAKQLRRVAEQQSSATLGRMESNASMVSYATVGNDSMLTPQKGRGSSSMLTPEGGVHTPGSVLKLHSQDPSPARRSDAFDSDWSMEDLRGAVEKMKAILDEQEKRVKAHTPATSNGSFSGDMLPSSVPPRSLFLGASQENYRDDLANKPKAVSRQTSRSSSVTQELPPSAVRQESQSSSSATATSTTVATPITPEGEQYLPSALAGVPQAKDRFFAHNHAQSFDLASLNPDLVTMLTPNDISPIGGVNSFQQKPTDILPSKSSSGLLPSKSTSSSGFPSRPGAPEPDSMGSEEINIPNSLAKISQGQIGAKVESTHLAADLTIASIASDGFGTMKSDQSVEEILIERRLVQSEHTRPSIESIEEQKEQNEELAGSGSPSATFNALALEPVATSSPPRKKTHTPRASSVSAISTPSSKRERRESRDKAYLAPPLPSVSEASPRSEKGSDKGDNDHDRPSPSRTSPSRSPLSRLKGIKDRPPLPQFEPNNDRGKSDSDSNSKSPLRRLLSGGNKSARAGISPAPSPTPPSRTLDHSNAMLTSLGHGRRPSSRASAVETSHIDRMRRVFTVANGSPRVRGSSIDEIRNPRMMSHGHASGRQSLELRDRFERSSPRPSFETSLSSLGPRTARAFAAAGVLDSSGVAGDFPDRNSSWRSMSAMGYRRDGLDREYGQSGGARSLASSPMPTFTPRLSGAAALRRSLLQDKESEPERLDREKSRSESWSRLGYNRTPEATYRGMIMAGASSETTSSPTSSNPTRPRLSSSNSSNLATLVSMSSNASNANTPVSSKANTDTNSNHSAIALLKERHELEKEALLNALAEAKKMANLEHQEKEEIKSEMQEIGVYVEELEEKLGEALARIRWMEREMTTLRETVLATRKPAPLREISDSSRRLLLLEDKRQGTPAVTPTETSFRSDRTDRASELLRQRMDISGSVTPSMATIYITPDPASSPENVLSYPSTKDESFVRKEGHSRIPSEASSIAMPGMDQSMSMLLQEKGYDEGYDQASLYSLNDGIIPSSPTLKLGKAGSQQAAPTQPSVPPLPNSVHPPNPQYLHSGFSTRTGGPQTPRSQRGHPSSAAMDMSPTTTTADYSFTPGSPGSLVLKPEDERHLGDLLSFMGPDDTF